ncbi:MAG: RIP metalloprotease RseP [bacterium JZ-2024 1]
MMDLLGSLHNLKFIVPVVVMLGFLILVHEFGHFVFAKLCGVVVPEFAIGFGPGIRLFQWRGTVFTLRLFPLGGFVRLKGLDETYLDADEYTPEHGGLEEPAEGPPATEDLEGNFRYKPAHWRSLILLGGILFNGVLAYVVFASHAFVVGNVDSVPVVAEVLADKPAARAGFQPGDIVRFVDGVPLSLQETVNRIKTSSGNPITFVVERSGQSLTLTVTPEPEDETDSRSRHIIGAVFTQVQAVSPRVVSVDPQSPAGRAGLVEGDEIISIDGISPTAYLARLVTNEDNPRGSLELIVKRGTNILNLHLDLEEVGDPGFVLETHRTPISLMEALVTAQRQVSEITLGFFRFFRSLLRRQKTEGRLTGPVGIIDLGTRVARQGLSNLVFLMGYISVVLAIVNLLPIPALDGGHLFFLIVEQAIRRRINPRLQMAIHTVGFVALLLLLVVITIFDVRHIMSR